MTSLWLAWLPLLFLPNFGVTGQTAFGSLEISDFLVVPYLALVALAGYGHRERLLSGRLSQTMLAFACWAMLSTLLIRERYGLLSDVPTITGVLKIAKMALYGTAGLLTIKALSAESLSRKFPWSLLAAGVVVAVSLFQLRGVSDELRPGQLMEGYKAKNATSVMLAMILCYLGGLWVGSRGTPRWRGVAGAGLAVMTLGLVLSDGRGGWVAALAGGAYLVLRQGVKARVACTFAAWAVLLGAAYGTMPEFQVAVDRTLWPDRDQLHWSGSGVGGIDDGARLTIWSHELAALPRSPLLGTGMFHRGPAAGIWREGSHNFFLQMFLETGLPGGLLVLGSLGLMWRQAGSAAARAAGQDVPVRASLIAAFVGGMSGEYFYGGAVLLVLLLVYAPVGSLRVSHASRAEEVP